MNSPVRAKIQSLVLFFIRYNFDYRTERQLTDMEYLMSASKTDLASICVSLHLPQGSKDYMIASTADVMLKIVRDSASNIIAHKGKGDSTGLIM